MWLELLNESALKDEKSVFIWGVGEDLWVVKVYFMVGIALDVVIYFQGVTVLMCFLNA